ncbi:hypothetical protein [Hymenobacter armeniacus]|uniref:Glycosyltransferase RgtA/B/C/D-like domain-containing protein n=1 Tax=Hymenobacter armeniacus TaxID=2771358 RepID=A0ABR8JN13_9BACT|nr:hypothetical protein [Hymenobacter armeniacus]MBD2721373.1 hypothetical protein [Hymenobacter armeniacus]
MLSLLNIGLVLLWWARWARPSAKEWAMAMVVCLTFPAQLIYANAVMSELLLQTTLLVMLLAALLYIRRSRTSYAAGVVVALVVALLIKPVFYPLAFAMGGVGAVLAWRRRKPGLAVLGVVPAVVVGLYMGWNEQRTGFFHFSSITDINLLHYNAAGVVRQVQGAEAEEKWVAGVLREANAQRDFASRQRVIQLRAKAVLWAHPVVYARQHALGMATFFVDPGRFDLSQFLQLAPPAGGGLLAQVRNGGLWRAIAGLPVGLLSWLGLIFLANAGRVWLAWQGFRRLGRTAPVWRYGRWVALALLLYVAGLTGPLGAARFLVPVWPPLLALALAGLPRRVIGLGGEGGANA